MHAVNTITDNAKNRKDKGELDKEPTHESSHNKSTEKESQRILVDVLQLILLVSNQLYTTDATSTSVVVAPLIVLDAFPLNGFSIRYHSQWLSATGTVRIDSYSA